jgi:hypothetical protein
MTVGRSAAVVTVSKSPIGGNLDGIRRNAGFGAATFTER